jgi:crotonobetainyl-CoA:carnitine CoA-transferase CaiB-like acyl-CoA transferase
MVVDVDHPQAGRTHALGCPVHFSATPTRVDRAAPLLGQHTRDVLREYGYSKGEIDLLISRGLLR